MPIELGAISLDTDVVIQQLRRDLTDDWFPDPLRYEDLLKQSHLEDIITTNLTENGGSYRPSTRELLNIPKPNFTLRYGLETSVADRAMYHALTAYLIPFYDTLIPWNVFSHRYTTNTESKYLFRRAIPSWADFTGNVRNSLVQGTVLLSTDLTNYFENINLGKLKKFIFDLLPEIHATAEEKVTLETSIELLFRCLTDWCYTDAAGLPQNRDASSFLANIYMLPVDRYMISKGYVYFRYMDDIKIVCKDRFEARAALKELGLELRKLGLSVNSGKTKFCLFEDADEVAKALDSGGDELKQIDAIWQTRSMSSIPRSFPILKSFTIRLLESGSIDTREFRYCIRRLQTLAVCPEFVTPIEYFTEITELVVKVIPDFPASTDQFVRFLRSVAINEKQMEEIAKFLLDSKKSTYTWQNYRLWCLLAEKEYKSQSLFDFARSIVSNGIDNATRSGAMLYLGYLSEKDDRILIAKNFQRSVSFLSQRTALIAMQELHFRPHIEQYVKPFLRKDLSGTFKELHKSKKYFAPPERISLNSVIDVERNYE